MDDDDWISEISISSVPDAGEVVVEHWHATLARPDADGTRWFYELMESPDLAEDWRMYEPIELPAVSLNLVLYPARESAEGSSGLAGYPRPERATRTVAWRPRYPRCAPRRRTVPMTLSQRDFCRGRS